jgi:hypothetical protein
MSIYEVCISVLLKYAMGKKGWRAMSKVRLLALGSMIKGGEKRRSKKEGGREKKEERTSWSPCHACKKGHPDLLLEAKRTIYFLGTDLAESEPYLGTLSSSW